MRIIIEIDEGQQSTGIRTTSDQALARTEAIDAGAPAESLVRAVATQGFGQASGLATGYTNTAASQPGAIDAGTPPDWLRRAIDQATATPTDITL